MVTLGLSRISTSFPVVGGWVGEREREKVLYLSFPYYIFLSRIFDIKLSIYSRVSKSCSAHADIGKLWSVFRENDAQPRSLVLRTHMNIQIVLHSAHSPT